MSLLLESSLRREGNECAFLIQISRPKLFNSAELICSHGGECLKGSPLPPVYARFMPSLFVSFV